MAKKKTATQTRIVHVPAAKPQAITVRAVAPLVRAAPATRARGKGKHHGGGRGGGDFMATVGEPALAGLVLGYIDKSATNIPTLPGLGRAGTLALACWFFRAHHPMLQKLAPGFAAIAAYEWQREGKVSGVEGVAAQL